MLGVRLARYLLYRPTQHQQISPGLSILRSETEEEPRLELRNAWALSIAVG